MPPSIYIDGQHGTTGLRIRKLLAERRDLQVLEIPEAARRDETARRRLLEQADLAILCLPDDAAREVAGWLDGSDVKLIDASTAHRIDEAWVYGLAELGGEQRTRIRGARRVSNPGCYPTGVVLLLRPLIEAAALTPTLPVAIHALSGYTGGGKPLIERWEGSEHGLVGLPFEVPYALERRHKHVPEMAKYAGLQLDPLFVPAVGPFRCGMRIQIPVHASFLPEGGAETLHAALSARYADEAFVRVQPLVREAPEDERRFDPQVCNGSNLVELSVFASRTGHVLLMAVLDNLGKGAAGAAVQNLNLMLDLPEHQGLT